MKRVSATVSQEGVGGGLVGSNQCDDATIPTLFDFGLGLRGGGGAGGGKVWYSHGSHLAGNDSQVDEPQSSIALVSPKSK